MKKVKARANPIKIFTPTAVLNDPINRLAVIMETGGMLAQIPPGWGPHCLVPILKEAKQLLMAAE